jgi:protein-tyrosine-phosphatase
VPGKKQSVPDPWYGDEAGFQPVYELIYSGCERIVHQIEKDFG